MIADPKLVKSKRSIELGAGTGVVGLTAALLGAQVVLTGNDFWQGLTAAVGITFTKALPALQICQDT